MSILRLTSDDDEDDGNDSPYRFTHRVPLAAVRDTPSYAYGAFLPPVELAVGDDEQEATTQMAGLRRLAAQYVRGRVQRHEVLPSSAVRMRTVLASFTRSYGARPVSKMSPRDIQRWLESRAHVAAGTRRNEVVIVRGFVRWLQQERKVRADPMLGIKSPKVPRSVPRALSDAEMGRLWAVLPDARAHAIVALMVGAGLRRGEVIALQTGDWDRDSHTLRVVGKGGHTRLVPAPRRVELYLHNYLVGMKAGPLIRRLDGVSPISNNYIGRLMRTWLEDSGVKLAAFDGRACHSLRHTLASQVATRQPDLRVLQQILGHQSLTSTQVYLRHAEMDKLREAMDLRFQDGAA